MPKRCNDTKRCDDTEVTERQGLMYNIRETKKHSKGLYNGIVGDVRRGRERVRPWI